MDSDHNNSRRAGAKGLADHNRPNLPKPVYNLGSPSWHWKDAYHYVGPEISGRITRLLYRTYFDDNGKPCGFSIKVFEEACFAEGERDIGLPHRDDDNGRMVRFHVGVLPRYYWRLNNVLRRNGTLSRDKNNKVKGHDD